MYGRVSIALENGSLVARRHSGIVADLEHWHYDTFLARYRDKVMDESLASFRIGVDGTVEAVEIEDIEDFVRTTDTKPN